MDICAAIFKSLHNSAFTLLDSHELHKVGDGILFKQKPNNWTLQVAGFSRAAHILARHGNQTQTKSNTLSASTA